MKVIFTALFFTLSITSSFAKDLSSCNGSYLVTIPAEKQSSVYTILGNAHRLGLLEVTDYNAKTAMFTVVGKTGEALSVMDAVQVIPSAIVECNSTLSLNF